MTSQKKSCDWNTTSELYLEYHDKEWGVPVFDDKKHFEFLVLESAQAGLSWLTILKKRENYRKAYDGFDPKKVARYSEKKKAALLANPGIIRNRLKIEASINNAKHFLEIQKEYGSFSRYIWSFPKGKQINGDWKTLSEIPATTPLSDAISADLRKRGFRFLGSTIIYAHLQATGIVNDHITSCFRHKEVKRNFSLNSKVLGILAILLVFILNFSCMGKKDNNLPAGNENGLPTQDQAGPLQELPDLADTIARFSRELARKDIHPDSEAYVEDFLRWFFGEAGIPDRIAYKAATSVLESPAFFMEFFEILNQDPYTYFLVDKKHPLPDNYEPDDLVPLKAGKFLLARDGLLLRKIALDALEEMADAAAEDGITFTIGSTYRSAEYQAQVYAREVEAYGRETADRQSARPGTSQHQLGLVIDLSPIDDAFVNTPASGWLTQNAGRFGFSLSFPDGYEEVTGYRYESWHYRYVGKDLAIFINNYFEGIQQYALQFINAWQEQP